MKLVRVLSLVTVAATLFPAVAFSQDSSFRLRRTGVDASNSSANPYGGANAYGGANPFAPAPVPMVAPSFNKTVSNAFASAPQRSTFAVPISATPAPLQQGFAQSSQIPSGYRPSFSATLSQQDLAILGTRDVVVLIDKSGSMNEMDCPAPSGLGRLMGGGGGGGGGRNGGGRNGGGGVGRGIGSAIGSAMSSGGIGGGMLGLLATAAGVSMPGGFSGGNRLANVGAQRTFGQISRWNWAGVQLESLAGVTGSVLPRGITAVFFDGGTNVFQNVGVQQIPALFSRVQPNGTTDVTGAVREQLDDYFHRRSNNPNGTRPLALAVITDGMPNNANSLKNVLVDASRKMTRPDEISVTFLQVGREQEGFQLLQELDDGLIMRGARADIVDSKMFPDVARFGLARALVLAITEHTAG